MNKTKKVIALIIVAIMIFTSAPFSAIVANAEESGQTEQTDIQDNALPESGVSIEDGKIYSDSDFIHYGSQLFFDSNFEYSNNGMELYGSNKTTYSMNKIAKSADCPTNSNYMMKFSGTGENHPGLSGFYQGINKKEGGVFYHVVIAKIPVGYEIAATSNNLGFEGNIKKLTEIKGTGKWELYIFKIQYGLLFQSAQYYTSGHIYIKDVNSPPESSESTSETIEWYVGYANVFDKTGELIFSDSTFSTGLNSAGVYNNNAGASDNVSVSRVASSLDSPSTSGYMLQVKTSPGISMPGYGGFRQFVAPEKGRTYYHKMVAKVPVGYYLAFHRNLLDAKFEWITDNAGTGEWKTYIYKLTVDKNAVNLGTFGYVALYPYGELMESYTVTEPITWYVAYSNIFKNYEFSEDFKAADLTQMAGKEYNGHTYIRYDYCVTWHMAKSLCERMGGHLATITSANENSAVIELLTSLSEARYYLGATDESKEGAWKWVTKENFDSYRSWASNGQPDNYNGVENYCEIYKDGKWNDLPENRLDVINGFICEFDDYYLPVKTVIKDGHLYSLYNEDISWTAANDRCKSIGGNLVSITSEAEQKLVEDLLIYGIHSSYWIGGTDKDSEGVWKWSDSGEVFWRGTGNGTATGYANWNSGEPNNNNGTNEEDYAYIYSDRERNTFGKWNDVNTTSRNGFICEIDLSTINNKHSYCHNGNKYEVYDNSLSWTDANEFAKLKGGHLATITSNEEQQFIESIISGKGKRVYYLGAEIKTNNFNWHWVTREKWEYTNWNINQPSFSDNNEFYLMIYNQSDIIGKWNDLPNHYSNIGFIIEYDDYYSNVAFDENNGTPINYFIAPTVDDGWTENSDGTLQISKNGLTVKYDPSDETFTFDSNGQTLTSSAVDSTGKPDLYLFDILPNIAEGQYLTLSAYCVDGVATFTRSYVVLEGVRSSPRCAIDINTNQGTFSNSSNYIYPAGPLTSAQISAIKRMSLWLYISSENGSSVSFDNYKIKLSVNVTDNPIETPKYSQNVKKIKLNETYGDLLFTPIKTGYDFTGWTYNEQVVESETERLSDKHHVLTANWTPTPYTLNFNLNGGTCETISKTVYYELPYGDLPVPTKAGYIFLGWYTKKKGGTVVKPTDIMSSASDVTVYACWVAGENTKCGENLSWALDNNKLIISGTGDMFNYTQGNAPWSSVSNYINSIEIQSGITGIGDYAFCNMSNVRSVEVPKTLTKIGDNAFENCLLLGSVSIPDGFKTVGDSAFHNCMNLTELVFPYSVVSIDDGAIDGCNSLSSITFYNPQCTLPEDWLTSIEDAIVYGYSNSSAETFANDNSMTFSSIGVYGENDNVLWIYTNATETLQIVSEGELPDYPENIVPWNVIKSEIKTVTFSDEITYIGNNTLSGCVNVSKITFPKQLTNIGENAFEDTQWFDDCDEGIVVVKTILYAYKSGVEEDNVVLSKGITRISKNFSTAFLNGVESPVSIQISNTVTDIDEKALAYATELTSLSVNPGNQKYKSVNNVLYSKDGSRLICYPAGLDGNYTIPNSVTEIASYAFAGCEGLTELAIGRNVVNIADNTFGSTGLTTIKGYYGSYAQTYAQNNGYEFIPHTSIVTLDCNDDDGTVMTMTVNTGCEIGDLYVPAQESYNFVGWYLETDDDDLLIESNYIVNEDITIYAYWEPIPEEVPYIMGISVQNQPIKTDYFVGDSLSTDGMRIIAHYSNGTTQEVTNGFYCVPSKLNTAGSQNVTVTYAGVTANFSVEVTAVVPISLSIAPVSESLPEGGMPKTVQYYVGQMLNAKGLKAIVTYNNGTQRLIKNSSDFEYTYDFSAASNASTVNLYYEENGVKVGTFYQVKVSNPPQISVEDVVCNAGEDILVPVNISRNSGLMGYVIYVSYDPTVLTPRAPRSDVSGFMRSDIENGTPGLLKVIWYNSSDFDEDGELFKIPFKVSSKAEAGSYDIGISYSEDDTFNENFDNVLLECTGSSVTVNAVERGSVIYSNDIDAVSGEYVDIPIYFENNIGIEDATYLTINFNTSVFSYVDYVDGIGSISRVTGQTTGKLKLRLDELSNNVTNGCLLTLRFKIADNAVGSQLITMSIDDEKWTTEEFTVNISKQKSSVTLKAAHVSATFGNTVTIPVSVTNNSGLMGYKVSAKYDVNKLDFVEAICDNDWNDGLFQFNEQNGTVDIIWTNSQSNSNDGVMFNIVFAVKPNVLSGTAMVYLSVDETNTFDEQFKIPEIQCYSSQITINGCELIIPHTESETEIDYVSKMIYNLAPGLNDVDDKIVAIDGYTYSLEKSSNKVGTGTNVIVKSEGETVDTYTVVLFGDVNGDGYYDGMDSIIVSCLANGMLNREDVDEAVYIASDCNHDGEINQLDVDLLNQAGILLAGVEQHNTEVVILESSSSNAECQTLIEQNPNDDTLADNEVKQEFADLPKKNWFM